VLVKLADFGRKLIGLADTMFICWTKSQGSRGSRRPCGSTLWLLLLAALVLLEPGCGGGRPPMTEANQRFLEAQEFLAKGMTDEAMDSLDASIAANPTVWAYRERANLLAQQGNDKAALEDCRAALAISPDDPDILWLQGEFAKPAAERFVGRFKTPPSANK
jgi:outer membrane protein assembly factor BamD